MSNLYIVAFVVAAFLKGVCCGGKGSLCRCEKYAFDNKPFVGIWNSPTIGCDFNFSTPINLQKFGIYENDHQTWDGKRVTIFSSAQLGLYPYYFLNGQGNYNGGLPQLVDLSQHLRKARVDIISKIPDPNYNGLAVIDWEAWRPIWDTNWNTKRVYKVRSVELIRSQHPTWTLNRLIEEAKQHFEQSARAMFEQTINLGKELRPKAFWGFYGFPDCFANQENKYQCTPEVQKFNDRLEWLYSSSTALFPSMYLLEDHPDNRDYVLGRLRETLRFSTKRFGNNRKNIPIFAYHRNIYENYPAAFNFLTKKDLDNTIGLAADIGASGVVFWGNRFDENTSPDVCERINTYVAQTLGPYLQNKIKQVGLCSSVKCGHRGHCIQRSVLTSVLEKKYENEQRLDSCGGPVSLLHDGNVLLQKKSQIPEVPLADASIFQHDSQTYTSADHPKTSLNEYNDLGSQRPKMPDFETMNKFFLQVNRTSSNQSHPHPRPFVKNNNQSILLHQTQHTQQTTHLYGNTSLLHRGNVTQPHPSKFQPHNNASHGRDSALQHIATAKHHSFNKTSRKGQNVNIKETDVLRTSNTKKSDIPHPQAKHMALHQNQKNLTTDEKKSMLVHKLLSSVRGSLITTPEFLYKHNMTAYHNNSRKSNIETVPDTKSPNMASKRSRKSWLPHMYLILIGVSIGGALMFSLIFVAVYYYVSLRETFPSQYGEGKLFRADVKTDKDLSPQAHSSPKGTEVLKENEPRQKRKDRERIRERKVENDLLDNRDKELGETNEKRKRYRSAERFSCATLQQQNLEEQYTKERLSRRSETSVNTSRSFIPRPRSVERITRNKETRSSRSLTREDERKANMDIGRSRRSRSLKRDSSIRHGKASDEELSEYEVNLNELR